MALTVLATSLMAALVAGALGLAGGPSWTAWVLGAAGWLVATLGPRGWPGLLLASLGWGLALTPRPEPELVLPRGGLARLSAYIERGGCGAHGCFAEAVMSRCEALEPDACLPAGTRVAIASAAELPARATVTALVRLRPRVHFDNPGDVASWVDTRSCCVASVQRGAQPRIDHVSGLASAIASFRLRVRATLEATLPAAHAGLARALLLGEGSAVEPALNAAIRDAGVSHVLAVSGMHVTLLVGAWVLLCERAWLFTPWALRLQARRVAATLGATLAPLLARVCGDSPSAARAAWTGVVMYAVTALGLRPAPMPVAALVVGAFAVLEPREALHPGFLLSVLATAALLADRRAHDALPPLNPGRLQAAWTRVRALAPVAFARGALRTSVRAWLATTPFLVLCFGQLTLVPLVANVALLPLGELLVPLAALHLVAAPIGFLPTAPVFVAASGAFAAGAERFAALDPGLALPPATPLQLLALAGIGGAGLLPCGWRIKIVGAVTGAALIAGSELALRLPDDTLRVTFLDVGQGDAILLESEGHAMLVDAGGAIGPGPDPGAQAVLPALRQRRIAALDRVVLTHPHPDHYGGLSAVFAALPVRELWDTGQGAAEGVQPVISLHAFAHERGARVRMPAEVCGHHRLGRASIEVLAPCPAFDFTREPNDNSFVLRLRHGRHTILLTGDSEREAEASLLGQVGQCDVLKLGHHGSRTSSTPAFLARVRPTLAVASAGRGNNFGHPHPEVVQRLGARLLRTDREGGIELTSDGRVLRVRTARHPAWRDVSAAPSS